MSTKANAILTDVITIKQVPHELKVFWNNRAKLNSRSMNKEIIRLLCTALLQRGRQRWLDGAAAALSRFPSRCAGPPGPPR